MGVVLGIADLAYTCACTYIHYAVIKLGGVYMYIVYIYMDMYSLVLWP